MKSSILALASLCTVFANEAQPMRKRTYHMKSSSGSSARVLTTEEYDPYLGIAMRQLQGPGAEEEKETVEPPMSMAATEPGEGGADAAAPGAEAGAPEDKDKGSPSEGLGDGTAEGAMSMSMPTEDQGFLGKIEEKVTDTIKDLTGQSG